MSEIIFGAIIVAIIVFGRIVIFGKATWKSSLIYTITFMVIYILFELNIKYNLNIKRIYFKLLLISWVSIVLIFELRIHIKSFYLKFLNKIRNKG